MPKYRITGPDGGTYEVTAPDGASEQDVLSFVQKNAGQPAATDYAQRAAGMDPIDLSVARSKDDEFGAFLRAQAEQPKAGESEEDRSRRLYGEITNPAPGKAEGVGRAVLQGASFGGGDEIVAAGAATLNRATGKDSDRSWDELYSAYLGRERDKLDQFRETNPVSAYGSEIAGAIPTSMALPGMGPGASLTSAAGRGALEAGAQGAAYGFLSGEGGPADRGVNAALTAGVAAPIGAAAPIVAKGARNLAESVMTKRAAAPLGMSRPSFDVLTRAMDADGTLGGQGAANISAAGPGGMLADAGPNARTILDTAIQRSGPAGNAAQAAIEGRATAANTAVTGALDNAFGVPTPATVGAGPKAPAISAAYKAAYSTPIDYASPKGQTVERIVKTRVPKAAIDAANALMRINGEESAQIMARVADDGSAVFERLPDVRQLDYITRGLNTVAEGEAGKGAMGGTTTLGRAYQNLSRELRGALKELVPEYKTALDLSAGPIRERQAREFGAELLSQRISRSDVTDMLSDMGAAEVNKVGEGVRMYIDDALANVKRALTDTNMDAREAVKAVKDLSSRANREKIATILGPQKSAALFGELDQAAKALDLRASVAGNSKTFARTAMDDVIRSQTDDGVVNAVRSGRPVNAGQRLVQALMGRSPEARERIADQTYSELVQALTGPRGPDAVARAQALQTARRRIGTESDATARLVEELMRGNAAVTAPAFQNVR